MGGTVTKDGRTTISLDLSRWDKGAPLNGGTADSEKAGTVAHEGEHGIQQKAQGMPTSNKQEHKTEQKAPAASVIPSHCRVIMGTTVLLLRLCCAHRRLPAKLEGAGRLTRPGRVADHFRRWACPIDTSLDV